MKAAHRRSFLLHRLRRPVVALAAPPLVMLVSAVGTAMVATHDAARTPPAAMAFPASAPKGAMTPAHHRAVRDAIASEGRRWPAEIEQLLSTAPQVDEGDGTPPMIQTDQRCSRVEDGLAHCVMLECQTAGGETACFEMVVTARRLRDAPGDPEDDEAPGDGDERPGAYDDGPLEGLPSARMVFDTGHSAPRLDNDHRHPRASFATTRF